MKISLKMRFKCVVGVLSFERVKKQKISLKLSAKTSEFIDYGLISEYIYTCFKQQKFIYLEDALAFFEENLAKEFPKIKKFKLKISKPQIFKMLAKPYKCAPSLSKKVVY